MNERLQYLNFCLIDPTEGNASTDVYFEALTDMVIVGVVASPSKDDAAAAIDISDDGTAVITNVDSSDADVPGTWQATGYGGSNTPVLIAKDSLVKIEATDDAAGTAHHVTLVFLVGEDWK